MASSLEIQHDEDKAETIANGHTETEEKSVGKKDTILEIAGDVCRIEDSPFRILKVRPNVTPVKQNGCSAREFYFQGISMMPLWIFELWKISIFYISISFRPT